MNEPSPRCPTCGGEMTSLQGGLICCSKCGFQGEPPKSSDFTARKWSKITFCILLFLPAAFSLASFQAGVISKNVGLQIGFAGLIVDAIASIYCGCWLAVHYCKNFGSRVLAGLFFISAIALVNFIIICVGCTSNLSFH